MSQNIFGYQGVNTPLASLTRGRYNVADYTQLREQFNARITALEKSDSLQQNEIIQGYLQIVASSTQTGYLSVASTGSFGGSLQTAGNLNALGGLSISQNATIGANAVVNGQTTLAKTELYTDYETSTTPSLLIQDTAENTQPRLYFLPNVPSAAFNPSVNTSGSSCIVSTNITGTALPQPLFLTVQSTTASGVRIDGISTKIRGGAGEIFVSGTGINLQGSPVTISTQANFQNVINASANGIQFSDGSIQTSAPQTSPAIVVNDLYYSQTTNEVITIPAASNKQTEIVLNFNVNCTVQLLNLDTEDATLFPDGIRYVSISKANMAAGDYTVTVQCPAFGGAFPYTFYTQSGANASTYSLNTGKYGVTFMITKFGNNRRTLIKSLVN